MPNLKSVQKLYLAVAVVCVASCFAIRLPVFAQDTDSTGAKLTSLLEQRRDVLKSRLEAEEALFKIGRGTPAEVISARDDLLDAEYELAATKAQRVDMLQQKLANAKQYEELMQQMKNDARASQADVLLATAQRLNVEIKLVREQQ